MIKLFVGNLPFSATEEDLRESFGEYGEVTDVFVPKDRESGRPRGFAFVSFSDREAGLKAIEELDGGEMAGRSLRISEAEERREDSRGGGERRSGGGERRPGGGGGRNFGGGDRRGGGGGGRRDFGGGGGAPRRGGRSDYDA